MKKQTSVCVGCKWARFDVLGTFGDCHWPSGPRPAAMFKRAICSIDTEETQRGHFHTSCPVREPLQEQP